MRVLVVCLGNICRSPMGEAALRKHIIAIGKNEEIAVDSAGTSHWHIGQPPDARAVHCARSHGIDISTLRARQVHHADFEHFDWLLCADASNQCDLLRLAPPGQRIRSSGGYLGQESHRNAKYRIHTLVTRKTSNMCGS